MSNTIRVRFAPSPTGHLHIGGARTALFNYLFARHNGGTFILRIEDTDRTRSTDEYIEAIIDGLHWLGLEWDEGPFRQTSRIDIYRSYIDRMIQEGSAYYCYCAPKVLEEKRKAALKSGGALKYDGRCRELATVPADRTPAVRFKMPQTGQTVINNLIKGEVVYENEQFDDFIIQRSDGTPTYNFVVVVDDVDMGITHVIRGDDHLNNTPKQIHIYRALDFPVPEFGHLPMILGSGRARLSKRHGAESIHAYREMGYLPESLLNYLVRLGWSFGDQEIFTRTELIEKFSLENVGKAAAIFNPEKLLWLNAEYIKNYNPDDLIPFVLPFLVKKRVVEPVYEHDKKWLSLAIKTLQERSRTFIELANSLTYYIAENIEIEEKAEKKFINEKTKPYLLDVAEGLSHIRDFSSNNIEEIFFEIMEKHDVKLGKIAQPVRVAVTGGTASPGIFEVLEIVGKEKTIRRLEKAIRMI